MEWREVRRVLTGRCSKLWSLEATYVIGAVVSGCQVDRIHAWNDQGVVRLRGISVEPNLWNRKLERPGKAAYLLRF